MKGLNRIIIRGTVVLTAAVAVAPILPLLAQTGGSATAAQNPAPVPSSAAPSTYPSCESPEHAQLDFWVGEWEVHWSAATGQSGIGTNRITRDHGGCVIVEHYQDTTTSFSGTSISSYRRGAGRWTQTFMGLGGFSYQATGGPAEGAAMEFVTLRQNDSQPEGRVRFEDVGTDSFTWRFQTRSPGGDWTDATVSRYRRRAGASAPSPRLR